MGARLISSTLDKRSGFSRMGSCGCRPHDTLWYASGGGKCDGLHEEHHISVEGLE